MNHLVNQSGEMETKHTKVELFIQNIQEAEANAKLGAAAPDLLAALKGLLDFALEYGPSAKANYEDWSAYFEEAQQAIKKATE